MSFDRDKGDDNYLLDQAYEEIRQAKIREQTLYAAARDFNDLLPALGVKTLLSRMLGELSLEFIDALNTAHKAMSDALAAYDADPTNKSPVFEHGNSQELA